MGIENPDALTPGDSQPTQSENTPPATDPTPPANDPATTPPPETAGDTDQTPPAEDPAADNTEQTPPAEDPAPTENSDPTPDASDPDTSESTETPTPEPEPEYIPTEAEQTIADREQFEADQRAEATVVRESRADIELDYAQAVQKAQDEATEAKNQAELVLKNKLDELFAKRKSDLEAAGLNPSGSDPRRYPENNPQGSFAP